MAQKTHPSAQPACDEMQTVYFSSKIGMRTASTKSPSWSRNKYLVKPSMSERRRGALMLAWAGVLLAGALAAWLRYQLVEPPALAERCAAAIDPPAWCALRTRVVEGFLNNSFGYLALAATALAWLRQRLWTAALAGIGVAGARRREDVLLAVAIILLAALVLVQERGINPVAWLWLGLSVLLGAAVLLPPRRVAHQQHGTGQ